MATYQESTGGTLPFYNDQIQALLNKGQTLAGQQATTAGMPAQTVAGFQPLQQQAFDLTQQNVGAYQPLLDKSQQAIQAYQQGAQFDPSQIAQYMNPYTQNVVSEIERLGNERFQNEMLPGLSSSFGGLGQFGSARQAALMADAAAKSQREVLGQQSQALNTGYQNAMQQYQDWTNMGLGANQQAATQLGNLAQAQQQMGLSDIGALTSAGQLQQQQQQKVQDLPFVNWQQQQAYPWQALNNWANLFKAGTPQSTTSWNTSFKKGGLVRFADGGRFSEDPLGYDQFSLGDETGSFDEDMNRRAFEERVRMLERVRSSPELQPVEEGNMVGNIGEAMMRAAAQGPANLGTSIGRAGSAYFDKRDAVRDENKARALARLTLEDKIAPELARLSSAKSDALRRALSPEQLRTVYNSEKNIAAQLAKTQQWGSANEAATWIEQQANAGVQNYVNKWRHPSGRRDQRTEFVAPQVADVSSAAQQPRETIMPTVPRDAAREAQQKLTLEEGEKSAWKNYNEKVLPAAESARKIKNIVSTISQLPTINDILASPVREQVGAVLNVFDPESKWAQESANIKSKRPMLAGLANAILQQAKGTQTEGDAQRAYDEFVQINDPAKAEQFILTWAKENAERSEAEAEYWRAARDNPQFFGKPAKSMENFSGMWKETDYGQTDAPVAKITSKGGKEKFIGFSEWRKLFAAQNPTANASDAVKVWNTQVLRGK